MIKWLEGYFISSKFDRDISIQSCSSNLRTPCISSLTASPDRDGVRAAGRPGLQHGEPDLAHRRLPRRAQEDPRFPEGQEGRRRAEDGHPRQRRLHLLQGPVVAVVLQEGACCEYDPKRVSGVAEAELSDGIGTP